jgi:hypothetical protein
VEMGEEEREQLLQPRFGRRPQPPAPAKAGELSGMRTVKVAEATWPGLLKAALALLAAPAKGKSMQPPCQQVALALAASADASSAGNGAQPEVGAAQLGMSNDATEKHAAAAAAASPAAQDTPKAEPAKSAETARPVSTEAPAGDATEAMAVDSAQGTAAAQQPAGSSTAPENDAANGSKQAAPKQDIPAPSRVSRRLEARRCKLLRAASRAKMMATVAVKG